MQYKELEKIRQEAHKVFISYEGVLGIGYGTKRIKGKDTKTTAVVVFVEKKLPKEKVKKGELIPKTFASLPTDVEEVHFKRKKSRKGDKGLYEDYEAWPTERFLDWGKIHRLSVEQKKRQVEAPEPRKKPPKRFSNNPPWDYPPPPLLTEVRGNLFIIEDPNATLSYTTSAGEKIWDWVGTWELFRGQFGDDYDFVAFFCFWNDSIWPEGIKNTNANTPLFHDPSEKGFGVDPCDNRAAWNWNTNRLLSYVRYSERSLAQMLHEIGHHWLFYVDYCDYEHGPVQGLLHEAWREKWPDSLQKTAHPGTWPDNDLSPMGYARHDWIEISPGIYRETDLSWEYAGSNGTMIDAGDAYFKFSPLEQYLMGFAGPDVVASSRVGNPFNGDPPVYPATGGDYQIIKDPVLRPDGDYDATPATITAQNIKWSECCWREPDHLDSQRVFHQAVIIVCSDIARYDQKNFEGFSAFDYSEMQRANHAINWRRATSGRSVIDTSLLRPNINDIYIRDNTSDIWAGFPGSEFWNSPDIFVRNQEDDPNQYLDQNIPNDMIHQKAKVNQDNWIYARIHNKSASNYDDVTVNFYLANYMGFSGRDTADTAIPRTEVIYPIDWHPESLIDTTTLPTVPAGGTAVAKVKWPKDKIPPSLDWHPCLLVEIIPLGTEPNKLHHVWENNKLAQKNVVIEYLTIGEYGYDIPFTVGNTESGSQYAVVEITKSVNMSDLHIQLDPRVSLGELQEIGGKLYHRVSGLESVNVEKLQQSTPVTTPAKELQHQGFLPVEGFKLERADQKTMLRMLDVQHAMFPVSLAKMKSYEMSLKINIDGKKLEQAVTMHIMQRNDKGKIVGGIEVQLRPGAGKSKSPRKQSEAV